MKDFSSRILSESSVNTFARKDNSIRSIKEAEEPLLYRFLEFNEAAAVAEVKSTKDFYYHLLKFATMDNGMEYDKAFDAIFNKYEAVRMAAYNLFSGYDCCSDSPYYDMGDKIRKMAEELKKAPIRDITVYQPDGMPNNVISEVLVQPLTDYCNKLLDAIVSVGNFNEIAESVPNLSEVICTYISKVIGIPESHDINEFISNYEAKFSIREITTSTNNLYSVIVDSNFFRANIYTDTSSLYGYTKLDTLVSLMKTKTKYIDINKARFVINNICDAISTYFIIIGKINDIIKKKNLELYAKNYGIIKSAYDAAGIKTEAMTMFGDLLTTKSIFDDLEPTDFNPTEFMDLSEITESEYKIDKLMARRYCIALEAKYLANKEYDKLSLVHEAAGEKIKQALTKLIEAVKKIISKFIADIMGIFAPEKVYLQKYKNIILNNTIPDNTTIQFEGHALEAMERLRRPFKIPTTSYNELVQKPEQFENEDKFFDMNKADFGIGGDFKRSNEGNLADDLKIYWGFKDEKNPPPEMTFKDVNPKIKDIYNFLLNTAEEAQKLNREVKNIDRTFKNYLISAKKYGNDSGPANTDTASGGTPKAESYYSAIFDRWVSIDEKTTIGQIQQPQSGGDNNQGGNNQGDQNNNQQNNNQNQQKTNTNLTRGDTDEEVKKSGDSEDKIARNMEIYTKTCKTVITARATGFRYCHQELMAIMKAIVKAKLGDQADIRNDKDAQAAAKSQEGKEPPATSKTPQ